MKSPHTFSAQFAGDYAKLVDELAEHPNLTIADIMDDNVIGKGRSTTSYRLDEMVGAGVLKIVGNNPTRYALVNRQPVNDLCAQVHAQDQTTKEPTGTRPSPDEQAFESIAGFADELDQIVRRRLAEFVEGFSDAWHGERDSLIKELAERDQRIAELELACTGRDLRVAERDKKIAELEAKLAKLKELFA